MRPKNQHLVDSKRLIYILIALLLSIWQYSYAQLSEYKIVWLNTDQQKMAGNLFIDLKTEPGSGEFNLAVTMEWLNESGLPLSEEQKPLLYLSENDYSVNPENLVFCTTFTETDQFDIYFSHEGNLQFEYLQDLSEPIELKFRFKYAFSEEDVLAARTYLIDYPSGNEITVRIPLSKLIRSEQTKTVEVTNQPDPLILEACKRIDSCVQVLQKESLDLTNLISDHDLQSRITTLDSEISQSTGQDSLVVTQIRDTLNQLLTLSTKYLTQLNTLGDELKAAEQMVNTDIPADSVLVYQRNLETISRRIGGDTYDIMLYRRQIRDLLSNIGVNQIPNDLEQQREIILSRFTGIFTRQLDSLNTVIRKHDILQREDIEPIISGSPALALNSYELDSLTYFHDMLIQQLFQVRNSHRLTHQEYMVSIRETGAIPELENIHNDFTEAYDQADRKFSALDNRINQFNLRVEELAAKNDYTLLWIGGSALLILIIFFLIRENRNRRIALQEKKRENAELARGRDGDLDLEELSKPGDGYFPFMVPAQLESVVKEVHFSFKAIKLINQMIHGSVRQNQARAFGGFLFGHQYKTTGQGSGMHIVMVDDVIQSATLRPDFVPGVNTNEDFVDEVDEVVSKNKKSVLLGWFTSADKDDFEMQEPLVKLHRTFFRERWQIALLVNPFSPGLDAALFLRRKTGFFETLPDTSSYLSLDSLYQYSLNPPMKKSGDSDFKIEPADFEKIVLNSSWSDSIVQSVSFHKDVLVSLRKELDNNKMRLGNQQASGYFYGQKEQVDSDRNGKEFVLYMTRFVELTNGDPPRELPGLSLVGWLSMQNDEIFNTLRNALPYHTEHFSKSYQVAVIVNTDNLEMRIFSQKHNLEMNNSIIETEEFNLGDLLK